MRAARRRIFIVGQSNECEVLVVGRNLPMILQIIRMACLRHIIANHAIAVETLQPDEETEAPFGLAVNVGVQAVHAAISLEFSTVSWLTGWHGDRFIAIGEWP